MTDNYARERILNALKENGASAAKVRQTVMRWALEDHRLMTELVAPHLSGIVAYAIARVEAGEEDVSAPVAPAKKPAAGKKGDTSFGMEILRHVAADNAAVFGQESGLISARKPPASQTHIDAINQIVKSGKGKK